MTNPAVRVGLAVTVAGGEYVLDATLAYQFYLSETMDDALARRTANALVPSDMSEVLAGGADSARALRALFAFAQTTLTSADEARRWRSHGRLHEWTEIELAPPVPRPSKIVAVGANYPAAGADPSAPRTDPVVFAKLSSCLVASGTPVVPDDDCTDLDFEGELAVVIGAPCHRVSVADAESVVAGYTIANDLTRRELLAKERERGHILFGKNFRGAAPCGPVLVTAEEFGDAAQATILVWVNQQLRQESKVSAMLHGVAELIAFCSQVPLEPGDLILTGSPKIQLVPDAPKYLSAGDQVSVHISGLGTLTTPIAATTDDTHPSVHEEQ